jgi:DNA-binding NtrC family response regulator
MTHEAASPQSEIQRQGASIVYLVDDDPSFLRALSRRLRAADYQVETFGSAKEFLTRRRSDAAGCALLDLRMPGPGGLELQEALTQAEEPLPVVFLTAHGDISSSVHAMKRGAVDFLTKPVRGDELLDAVQRALARAPRRVKRGGRSGSGGTRQIRVILYVKEPSFHTSTLRRGQGICAPRFGLCQGGRQSRIVRPSAPLSLQLA